MVMTVLEVNIIQLSRKLSYFSLSVIILPHIAFARKPSFMSIAKFR